MGREVLPGDLEPPRRDELRRTAELARALGLNAHAVGRHVAHPVGLPVAQARQLRFDQVDAALAHERHAEQRLVSAARVIRRAVRRARSAARRGARA